ncbi:MAG: ACT domain-containing protein [Mogibacterium sp.]|nr:ACT domain-containing protein [Mogibacterium sp.]
MKNQEKAVVTVVGKDAVGILAKAATCCAEENANVIEVTQSVMAEYFTMIMLIDVTEMTCKVEMLQEKIKDRLPGMEVHVMHENIFSAMHTI